MSKSVLMKKRVCIIIEENKFKEVSDTVWGFFERYNYREDNTKGNELRKNKTLTTITTELLLRCLKYLPNFS